MIKWLVEIWVVIWMTWRLVNIWENFGIGFEINFDLINCRTYKKGEVNQQLKDSMILTSIND